MSIPVFAARHVYAAVDPADAVEAVGAAFVAHARGEWLMPSKVYVPAPPDGDFRAMPARGGGYALLKWVTSFPRNPERGLPTVGGIVLLSDTADGRLLAQLDAGAVTALRTGAAAVLAAETLAAGDGPACGDRLRRQRARRGADVPGARPRGAPVGPGCGPLGRGGRGARGRHGGNARGGARRGRRRHRHAGPRDPLPRGEPPGRPARQPHGRRRAGQGGDRRRGARPRPGRGGRVGAGEPQRRRLPRGRGRRARPGGRDRAGPHPPRRGAGPGRTRSTSPSSTRRASRCRTWRSRRSSTSATARTTPTRPLPGSPRSTC